VLESCESTFEGSRCELILGHRRKHRRDGISWSDAGAARVAKEKAEAADLNHVWEVEKS
jgi:hypothetical protein